MPNYTREELSNKTALTNQMRNNLYYFLRFLISKGLSEDEIKSRVDRMGKNIALTLLEEKDFHSQNLEEIISAVYSELFDSRITISEHPNSMMVEDKKCSLCKYKREDLTIAPCNVITAVVTEILRQAGFTIDGYSVNKSVALGDISCTHIYQLKEESQ